MSFLLNSIKNSKNSASITIKEPALPSTRASSKDKIPPKKETRKKRAKKAETEIPENKNTVSQKEIKPEAQMEEVVPEVQDLSEINIIRGGEEPVRESSVYEKELEEKFGASKKIQSEPKTPTKTDTVDEPVKQKKEPVR